MEYCALGDLSLFIKRRDTLGSHKYTRDMIAKYPNAPGASLNGFGLEGISVRWKVV
jgi:serine/threonine-protein kinase ULK/ATG1